MTHSLLSIVAYALVGAVLTAGLVVPAAAVTADEPSSDLPIRIDDRAGEYAAVSDGELELRFDRLNERAASEFDAVFTIAANESGAVWIDHDVEGVTFYVDDPEHELDEPVALAGGETVDVGVAIDTRAAGGTETFTIAFQSHGESQNRDLPSSQTAALGVPMVVGLFTMITVSRRKL